MNRSGYELPRPAVSKKVNRSIYRHIQLFFEEFHTHVLRACLFSLIRSVILVEGIVSIVTLYTPWNNKKKGMPLTFSHYNLFDLDT